MLTVLFEGYDLVEQIGGGGFSTVFRAVHFQEHRVAACKVVALTPETKTYDRKTIEKEMQVHSALKHPNVLEFLNAVVVEANGRSRYHPGIYMLLELAAGGDLFDKIAPDVGIDEEIAHYYFTQILSGMDYIHREGVCHRDLKPENIMLDAAGILKISDFGLCSVYKLKESGKTRLLSERCGSLPYIAPELAGDAPYSAEPIDVWGIGVILFTMLVGNTPWDEPSDSSFEFNAYINGEIFDKDPWNRLSPMVLSLIGQMLNIDPDERLTIAGALRHPWVSRDLEAERRSASQVATQGPVALAHRLTQSLRNAGDLEIATPQRFEGRVDADGDQIMGTSTAHNSQFTQSLLLFSQTQSGTRYTPCLTRFYCSLGAGIMMKLIHGGLLSFNVKCRASDPVTRDTETPDVQFRIRIGGMDRRKVRFKGWVTIESFAYGNVQGSFVVMQRDEGSPLSWRQLWKALIKHEDVSPHVLRK
ncbi:kinase-like domain-containing protein [Thelephora terrestris]|uniref:Kinase-like domain-containing protein n=1 Tax=Thelephora terrestris TaxID=56493 RepID=A0A9P6L9R6_9AGAM|nr:kinase-like domain-containing protein [Thelephora terrestris]